MDQALTIRIIASTAKTSRMAQLVGSCSYYSLTYLELSFVKSKGSFGLGEKSEELLVARILDQASNRFWNIKCRTHCSCVELVPGRDNSPSSSAAFGVTFDLHIRSDFDFLLAYSIGFPTVVVAATPAVLSCIAIVHSIVKKRVSVFAFLLFVACFHF